MEQCVILLSCFASKQRTLLSDDPVSNVGAWKPQCMLVFLLCNTRLLSMCLAFSSAVAL